MRKSNANAQWQGDLRSGSGTMELGSGAFTGAFSFTTRFGSEAGTNPEELIGAALAGCFSMALSNVLSEAGHVPERIRTDAEVSFENQDSGPAITKIALTVRGEMKGLDQSRFAELAEQTGRECPVSRALKPEITVDARLIS